MMLTNQEIMEAIHNRIAEGLPELCYITEEFLREEHKRPAVGILHIESGWRDANKTTVQVNSQFHAVIYPRLNEYGDMIDMARWQERVMLLFLDGYLRVADRAIPVKVSTAGVDPQEGYATEGYVALQFEYLDSRAVVEDLPKMQEIHMEYTEE